MRAARVIAAVLVLSVVWAPRSVGAQTTAGEPTSSVTISDTKWASRRLHLGLAGSFATLQALDVVSTLEAVNHRGAREANPLVSPMVQKPMTFIAVKAATTVGTIYLTRKIARKHPRLATVMLVSLNVAMSAVVASNFSLQAGR
jgi:hypothetical protein